MDRRLRPGDLWSNAASRSCQVAGLIALEKKQELPTFSPCGGRNPRWISVLDASRFARPPFEDLCS
jgi:hypothetical protein